MCFIIKLNVIPNISDFSIHISSGRKKQPRGAGWRGDSGTAAPYLGAQARSESERAGQQWGRPQLNNGLRTQEGGWDNYVENS